MCGGFTLIPAISISLKPAEEERFILLALMSASAFYSAQGWGMGSR
jgi:hypothetical protein